MMLLPISFNAKTRIKTPVGSAAPHTNLPVASLPVVQPESVPHRGHQNIAPGSLQWVSFGAQQQPSEGALATKEFEGAKDQLRTKMQTLGHKLDDANFLILSSGKKLYGIVPKSYSNKAIKDFEKALIEALKELSAEAFPRLAEFANASPAAVLIERVVYYRPA